MFPPTLQQHRLCMSHIRSKGTSSELSCGMSCGAWGGAPLKNECAQAAGRATCATTRGSNPTRGISSPYGDANLTKRIYSFISLHSMNHAERPLY